MDQLGRLRRIVTIVVFTLLGAGCDKGPPLPTAPPRAESPVIFPQEPSVIGVDLTVDLAGLERDLEAEIPRTLWKISQNDVVCVPSKKVDLELFRIKTPKIKCDIEGTVKRGKLRISGRGSDLVLRVPIEAEVKARDIGGILKETGNAAAVLTLALRLDVTRDWKLRSDVRIDHTWSKEPGIDFLGRRITFTEKADVHLAELRRKAEAGIEKGLARVQLKAAAQRGWRAAHTVLELNQKDPAVWAKIRPERFHYGGYTITGKTMRMTLGLQGALEVAIGKKPEPIAPGPLPPIEQFAVKPGYAVLNVPVVSEYAVLEPVIARALQKRSQRPFDLGKYGAISARFSDIEVYGTTRNRIAVGITFAATSDLSLWKKAEGRLYLSARPINTANSRLIGLADLKLTGATDMVGHDILIALANSPDLRAVIADALKQNFEGDFVKLRRKIDRAIATRKDGPIAYSVKLQRIETGRIQAFGQGLYLPVALHARMKAELVKMD